MELSKDETLQNYAKNCGHCNRNTLLPYENEFTCFSCGYNVNKQKYELFKIQRKKKFYKSLDICRSQEIFLCVDLYKIYEGDDYDEIYKVLSTLKNENIRINITLIEIYKDMMINSDIEQNYW